MAGWSQAIKVPVNQADDGPSGEWGNFDDRWDQSSSIHGEFTSLWPMIFLVQLFFTVDLEASPDKYANFGFQRSAVKQIRIE